MFIYGECDSHCPLLIIQGPAEIPDGFWNDNTFGVIVLI
jgi:hypothetical protein